MKKRYRITSNPFSKLSPKPYIQKVVRQMMDEWFGTVRSEVIATTEDLVKERLGDFEHFEAREIAPQVGHPYRLLDQTFQKPTTVLAYLDLSSLEQGEEARVGLFIGIRGKKERDLIQIEASTYQGPIGEAITIGPTVVVGRVVITYNQMSGESKLLHFQTYAGRIHSGAD
jgi:hypothetical protein